MELPGRIRSARSTLVDRLNDEVQVRVMEARAGDGDISTGEFAWIDARTATFAAREAVCSSFRDTELNMSLDGMALKSNCTAVIKSVPTADLHLIKVPPTLLALGVLSSIADMDMSPWALITVVAI